MKPLSFPLDVLSICIACEFHELAFDICLSEIDLRLSLNLLCLYFALVGAERKQIMISTQTAPQPQLGSFPRA